MNDTIRMTIHLNLGKKRCEMPHCDRTVEGEERYCLHCEDMIQEAMLDRMHDETDEQMDISDEEIKEIEARLLDRMHDMTDEQMDMTDEQMDILDEEMRD